MLKEEEKKHHSLQIHEEQSDISKSARDIKKDDAKGPSGARTERSSSIGLSKAALELNVPPKMDRGALLEAQHDIASIAQGGTVGTDDVDVESLRDLSLSTVPGEKTRVRLVHRGETCTVYHCRVAGDDAVTDDNSLSSSQCAVKILNEPHPTDDCIARFFHEYDVTRGLSECPAARGVVKRGEVNGSHAMYFHWAHGITLREWMRLNSTAEQGTNGGLQTPLHLAIATATALSQMHERGVIHNKLSSDNIIVSDEGSAFSVKLIDLSLATLAEGSTMSQRGLARQTANGAKMVGSEQTIRGEQADLIPLGVVLYEIFTNGKHPIPQNESDERSVTSISMFSQGTAIDGMVEGKKRKVPRRKPVAQPPQEHLSEKSQNGNVSANSNSSCSDGMPVKDCAKGEQKCPSHMSYIPPSKYGVPAYVSAIITSLLGSFDDHYKSAKEVAHDLSLMLDEPDRFSRDSNAEWLRGQLLIRSDNVYGRKAEMSMLMYSFRRVITTGGGCEMALVSGLPGTGKTMLIRQVRRPLLEAGGFFLEGKFEQYKQPQPLSAILAALNIFCEQIMLGSDAKRAEMIVADIKEAVGPYSSMLAALIPNFGKMVGVEPSCSISATMGGRQAQNRLNFLTQMFVRALTSPSHPIVLSLDDLQWADNASLKWIQTLVSDPEIRLLFVGSFRDNEVSGTHPLTVALHKIHEAGVRVTRIKLSNSIGIDSVNELISDSLCVPKRLTRSLAAAVHSKTEGVALFVVQFLRSLHDGGELWFSMDSRGWNWDLVSIRSKDVADNVVDLMIKRMRSLPRAVLSILRTAACLGFQFDASILEYVKTDEQIDTRAFLDVAIDEGFIEKVGTKHNFVHDKVHQAAYCLLPPMKRELFHFRLGMLLYTQAPQEELDNIAMIAADQISRGYSDSDQILRVTDSDQRLELAKINLKASQVAMASSAFVSAATYLKAGVSFISELHWEQNYWLCLQLFDLAAEALFVAGDVSAVQELLERTLSHARCFDDKLNAYRTLINAVAASGDLQAAVGKAFEVLADLGETFPTEIDESLVNNDLLITKGMINNMSDETVYNLPEMTDGHKLAAMKFLNAVLFSTFIVNPRLCDLLLLRIVQLSLKYGVCNVSPIGFAGFGAFVLNERGGNDIEYGYRLGKVALSLLDRLNARECTARVYNLVFGMVAVWKEPIQLCVKKYLIGHEAGMASGDIEFAIANIHQYVLSSFVIGRALPLLDKEVRTAVHQMIDCNHEGMVTSALSLHLSILNLMGRPEDAIIIGGEAVTEEKLLADMKSKKAAGHFPGTSLIRIFVAFVFGDYERVIDMLRKWQTAQAGANARFNSCMATFMEGLLAFKFARETKQEEWRGIGGRAIARMKLWSEHSSWNCINKLQLLEAESCFLVGDSEKAAALYDASINNARDHQFVHEQAIAFEKAGEFYAECVGDNVRSLEYYCRSKECYADWGCFAKVERLNLHIASHSGVE